MASWTGRLGGFAAVGFVLACLAPGCDGEAAKRDTRPIPADHLTDNAHQTNADGGTEVSVDPGTEPDAGGTRTDGGGATSPMSTSNCQADPDPNPVLLPSAQLDPDVIGRAAVIIAGCSLSDDGMARTVAAAYAADGIRVNTVVPGYTETPLVTAISENAADRAAIVSRIPLGRPGRPEDVEGIMVFLASDESSYATGSLFRVDGGMTTL